MLTDLGMNIPANGPFVISQVLNKGKKSKSKQGILEIRATFGSACSTGYALAGACCAPRQDPRRAAHCKYRSCRIPLMRLLVLVLLLLVLLILLFIQNR